MVEDNKKSIEKEMVEEEKVDVKMKEEKIKPVEEKKSVKKDIQPKEKAVVRGMSLHISSKNSFAICKSLKGKTPDRALEFLEKVLRKKAAIPMPKREVAHRPGKGMAGGKYPINAVREIVVLLNQLKANANVNQIENPIITIAKADKASRPMKRGGRQAKRTHVYIEVQDRNKINKKKK